MSRGERDRIEREVKKPIECPVGGMCSMLTIERRCAVYEIRPIICRLWGLTRAMRCPYGCEPERWLSDEECARYIYDADMIGGQMSQSERDEAMEHLQEHVLADPVRRWHLKRLLTEAGMATLDGRGNDGGVLWYRTAGEQ